MSSALQMLQKEAARSHPSQALCHRLGQHFNEQMTHVCTLEELAAALQVSKARAYQLSYAALGKYAFHFFKRFGMPGTLRI